MTLSLTKSIGDLNIVSMKKKHMKKEQILSGKRFIKGKIQEIKRKKAQKKAEKLKNDKKSAKANQDKIKKTTEKTQATINKIKDEISKE